MAILDAPLLSFSASGKIANAVVYFGWKGLNCARKYVVPANPRSAPQLAQRAILTAGVGAFHVQAFTAADMVAWNRWAGTLQAIMSGFNAFMRLYIEKALIPVVWQLLSQVEVDTPTAVGFDVDVENSGVGRTLRAAIGVSRTHFPTLVALVDDADNTYSLTWAAGSTGTDYYVRVQEQIAGTWYEMTGIYHVKTS